MANHIVPALAPVGQPSPVPSTPTPSFKDILTASDDQWQALATRAGADLDFCERARASHQQRQQSPKPKRTRRQRPSRARRTPSPTSLLSHIAPAMAEAVDRVNTQETILVNRPGGFVEVLS